MAGKVIIIAGPTASGKTYLSLLIAQKLDTEIISADSRQFYKYLDIGTAKPGKEMLRKIKHHFINALEPEENYNASRFEVEALEIIGNLHNLGKIPVVAGGSGLYIKALIDGIVETADTDEGYRTMLLNLKAQKGNDYLYRMLQKADPVSSSKMLPQNWKRIIRALEVLNATGKPIWQHHGQQDTQRDITFYQFALDWDRDTLYKRIEQRVDEMISAGLVDEVKEILNKGYSADINSFNTVGYKEIISYLNNEITLERAVELIKRNTRRYAKRQLTWFRGDSRIEWIKINSNEDLVTASSYIINKTGAA